VPTPNVSVVDLVINTEKKGMTADDVNGAFREAAARLRRHHRLIGEADAPPSPAWPAAYSAALISALAEARAGDRFGLAGR